MRRGRKRGGQGVLLGSVALTTIEERLGFELSEVLMELLADALVAMSGVLGASCN